MDGGEGGIDSSGAAFAALTPAGRSAKPRRVQNQLQAEFVEPSVLIPPIRRLNRNASPREALCLDGGGSSPSITRLPEKLPCSSDLYREIHAKSVF
jgi:hypothetical protein